MDSKYLVKLCTRTWSLTALGLIASGVDARVSPLAAAAGCGRTSMSASVEHLVALGLLERNPGHGHPLRPEFRLTAIGELIAEWASQLSSLVNSEQNQLIIRNKWTLPLISCLSEERRYSDLRRELLPVTDRALSNCLSNLTDNSWVKRSVSSQAQPPMVTYHTILLGQTVQEHLMVLPKVAWTRLSVR